MQIRPQQRQESVCTIRMLLHKPTRQQLVTYMTGPQEVVCQLKVSSVSPADSKAQNDEDGTENDQGDDGDL
jgi:hypothetical protein